MRGPAFAEASAFAKATADESADKPVESWDEDVISTNHGRMGMQAFCGKLLEGLGKIDVNHKVRIS